MHSDRKSSSSTSERRRKTVRKPGFSRTAVLRVAGIAILLVLAAGLALALMRRNAPAPALNRFAGDPQGIVNDPCRESPDAENLSIDETTTRMLHRDFGQQCRYYADDQRLLQSGQSVRVVFFGDSIAESWGTANPGMFESGTINRGIGGQTTAQMLVRYRQDVIELRPKAVHITAGINDLAGNTGPQSLASLEGRFRTMAELARANGIAVVFASILPVGHFTGSASTADPRPAIETINAWLATYARDNGFGFVDYHGALVGSDGAMKQDLTQDGVHPNAEGFALMSPLAEQAIARAIR